MNRARRQCGRESANPRLAETLQKRCQEDLGSWNANASQYDNAVRSASRHYMLNRKEPVELLLQANALSCNMAHRMASLLVVD